MTPAPPASFGLGRPGDNNASAESSVPIDSSTPWMAASDGNLSLLQSSLSTLNLPFTAADDNGYTLLHAASSYCQIATMRFLLEKQVPVNAVDNDGDSALHHAEHVDAAKVLIENGADINLKNAAEKTPLQAKQEDLEEQMEEDDEDDEIATLRELIEYLSSLSTATR